MKIQINYNAVLEPFNSNASHLVSLKIREESKRMEKNILEKIKSVLSSFSKELEKLDNIHQKEGGLRIIIDYTINHNNGYIKITLGPPSLSSVRWYEYKYNENPLKIKWENKNISNCIHKLLKRKWEIVDGTYVNTVPFCFLTYTIAL